MTRKEAYADCLLLLCGQLPPDDLIPDESWSKLDDARSARLQDFVCMHVLLPWSTGIGALEAMDVIVDVAEENANLKDGFRMKEPTP